MNIHIAILHSEVSMWLKWRRLWTDFDPSLTSNAYSSLSSRHTATLFESIIETHHVEPIPPKVFKLHNKARSILPANANVKQVLTWHGCFTGNVQLLRQIICCEFVTSNSDPILICRKYELGFTQVLHTHPIFHTRWRQVLHWQYLNFNGERKKEEEKKNKNVKNMRNNPLRLRTRASQKTNTTTQENDIEHEFLWKFGRTWTYWLHNPSMAKQPQKIKQTGMKV